MKKNRRFFLGLVSSLLLSAGLTKAAASLDPLSQPDVVVAAAHGISPDDLPARSCNLPCNLARGD